MRALLPAERGNGTLAEKEALADVISRISTATDSASAQQRACGEASTLAGPSGWALLLLGDDDRLVVSAIHGVAGDTLSHVLRLNEWPAPLRAAVGGRRPHLWTGGAATLGLPAPDLTMQSEVLVIPLQARGIRSGVLMVGGPALDRTEVHDAIHIVALQLGSALEALGTARWVEVVFDTSTEALFILETDGTVSRANLAAGALLGCAIDDLHDEVFLGLVEPDDALRVSEHLSAALEGSGKTPSLELRFRHAHGGWVDVEATTTALPGASGTGGLVISARDIRERKDLEQQLSHWALHDPLTNLANRSLLHQRIRDIAARNVRRGQGFALLLLDLDDFKWVNDTYGHEEGDRLLVEVAERLRATARTCDTVARLSGDEFLVLVDDVTSDAQAIELAERVLEAFRSAVTLKQAEVTIHASIGLRIATPHEDVSPDRLLRDADLAMYAAKDQGKSTWATYDPAMDARVRAQQAIRSGLRKAVDRNEFVVQHQPIVDLRSDTLVGTEALVRWNHPTRGMLPPVEFIEIAEATGLIVEIGAWVLEEACRLTAEWRETAPDLRLSVNLSPRQLMDPQIVDTVRNALSRTGLPPQALALEITESMLADRDELAKAAIDALDDLGVGIHIDDFGTGYSALGYLGSLPVDAIKIDRSFVDGIDGKPEDAAVAKAICHIGKMLDLELVAEGIERASQIDRLLDQGCTLGQGFHFSEPLDTPAIEEWLAQGRPDPAVVGATDLTEQREPDLSGGPVLI